MQPTWFTQYCEVHLWGWITCNSSVWPSIYFCIYFPFDSYSVSCHGQYKLCCCEHSCTWSLQDFVIYTLNGWNCWVIRKVHVQLYNIMKYWFSEWFFPSIFHFYFQCVSFCSSSLSSPFDIVRLAHFFWTCECKCISLWFAKQIKSNSME